MTFSTKLSLSVSAAFLMSFIVMAYVGYKSTTGILENEIRANLEDHAFNAVDKLDRMLHERYADIGILGTDTVLSSRGSTPEQITERLKQYYDKYKMYSSLSFFDMNRVRIADTTGKDIGRQHAMTEYWQEIAAGKDIVMKITESVTTKQVVIHFAAVVKDTRGKPFGVVASRMPVESIYEIVGQGFQPGKDQNHTRVELLDSEGLILYSSYNIRGVLKEKSGDWEFLKTMISSGTKAGSVSHAYECEEEITAFAIEQGYKSFPGNGWTLVICTPAAIAFAPAYVQGKIFAYLFSVFIGIVLVTTFLVSRAAVRPLKKLARAATGIGKGNLDVRVDVSSGDEIGQLATAFNTMADNLADSEKIIRMHHRETERFNKALVELARDEKIYRGDLSTALKAITEASVHAMDVSRVSIWFYTDGNAGIRCIDLYDMNSGNHSEGVVLEALAYPGYFKAMQEENLIAADDAVSDPRTREFSESYLKPLGITSMLDVPIRVSGMVVGVVCHEHVGAPREWTVEEQSFVTAIAGFTSVAIEIYERKKVEESLRASEGTIKKLKEDVELKLDEAERMNKIMVGRELKMAEMRMEIERLKARLGELEKKG